MTSTPAVKASGVARIVLLTGAAGGLGRAIAHRLTGEGATVVATDLPRMLPQLNAIGLPGEEHVIAALDVADEEGWRAVVADVRGRFGRLDVLVNNAAIGALGTVTDEEADRYRRIVDVGQTGTWLGMKHAGALIEETGGGAIVNMCSVLGTVAGFGDSVAYAAAKGAVRTMTKNAALHWAGRGVRVNSLHPGYIETDAVRKHYAGTPRYEEMVAHTPLGRLGTEMEVAAAVSFLAGDDSSFVTGSELYVDGGWTCV